MKLLIAIIYGFAAGLFADYLTETFVGALAVLILLAIIGAFLITFIEIQYFSGG